MKILIVDNHDSFTYNLCQQFALLSGEDPVVVRNNEKDWSEIEGLGFDCAVISPGPGRPQRRSDLGLSAEIILKADFPVLGVCLGHQAVGHLLGGRVRRAREPAHGRVSEIFHDGLGLFEGLPSPARMTRYHSWALAEPLPEDLAVQARSSDGTVMALRHRSRPLWGVQFHPESVCSEEGGRLLANFLKLAAAGRSAVAAGRPAPRAPRRPQARGRPPASMRLDLYPDAERLFLSEFAPAPSAFWLDSGSARPGLSRFSFLGGASGEVLGGRGGTKGSLWGRLAERLGEARAADPDLPFDFQGGYVGCFGYEGGAFFMRASRFVALDHAEKAAYLVDADAQSPQDSAWIARLARRLAGGLPDFARPEGRGGGPALFRLRHGRGEYLRKIESCLEALRAGESYELCLTNRVFAQASPPPLDVYRILRRINPAPFGAYLKTPGAEILSSSPERFLRVGPDGGLEAKPIKGTRPRGRGAAEDRRLAEELRSSPKERAENLMITDLLRNDLGSVAEAGSVQVDKLMDVESYESVHQLVSTIRARLRPGLHALDAVRAAFPGGSMTGAPKKRSMAILKKLEGSPRGWYSGALGWLGWSGAADLSIVIRAVEADARGLSIGAGGAVTVLSDPEQEFEEMLLKARAPMQAVALAATGRPGFAWENLRPAPPTQSRILT